MNILFECVECSNVANRLLRRKQYLMTNVKVTKSVRCVLNHYNDFNIIQGAQRISSIDIK